MQHGASLFFGLIVVCLLNPGALSSAQATQEIFQAPVAIRISETTGFLADGGSSCRAVDQQQPVSLEVTDFETGEILLTDDLSRGVLEVEEGRPYDVCQIPIDLRVKPALAYVFTIAGRRLDIVEASELPLDKVTTISWKPFEAAYQEPNPATAVDATITIQARGADAFVSNADGTCTLRFGRDQDRHLVELTSSETFRGGVVVSQGTETGDACVASVSTQVPPDDGASATLAGEFFYADPGPDGSFSFEISYTSPGDPPDPLIDEWGQYRYTIRLPSVVSATMLYPIAPPSDVPLSSLEMYIYQLPSAEEAAGTFPTISQFHTLREQRHTSAEASLGVSIDQHWDQVEAVQVSDEDQYAVVATMRDGPYVVTFILTSPYATIAGTANETLGEITTGWRPSDDPEFTVNDLPGGWTAEDPIPARDITSDVRGE